MSITKILSTRIRRIVAGAVVVGLGTAGVPASAQSTIPHGTQIAVHLSSPDIRTNKNAVGDSFQAHVTAPYASGYLRGATVYGHVASIQSGGQGRTAQLSLRLDRIVFSDGQARPLDAYSTSINEVQDNTTARKAVGAGVGAAVGSQTIGRVLGGTLGGVVGIVGGAAGGYAYAKNNRPNFNVATGARMLFVVAAPISIPRRQMTGRN